ncbi:hypothetical protein Asp14428_41780 [Actinoplanes sp. NBRC 14428]|nr:hypothetical protein Asp14428_41780 [Actinoplanes sp. NBRC 14428]
MGDENWQNPVDPKATFRQAKIDVGDLEDYKKWVQEGAWRKLKASVNGGSALSSQEARDYAASLVVAQSLADASGAFNLAYQTLSWLETIIHDHTHALAGKDKAWQGPAADAFVAKMDYFAKYLGNQAEHIVGAAGTNGSESVPNQLWNSARFLAWAQNALNSIDVQWAEIALAADSDSNTANGVAISHTRFAKPMTEQMGQVVDTLATQYEVTYSKVTPPPGNGDVHITPGSPTPPTTPNIPTITPPNLTLPQVPTPPPLNVTPPPNLTLPPPPPNASPPPNFSPISLSPPPNLGGVNPPPIQDPPGFDGLGDNARSANVVPPGVQPPPGLAGGNDFGQVPPPSAGGAGFNPPVVPPPPGLGGNGSGNFVPPVIPPGPGAGNGFGNDKDKPGGGFSANVPKPPAFDAGAGGGGVNAPGAGGAGSFDPPVIPNPPGASDPFGNGVNAPGMGGGGMPFPPGGAPGGGPGGSGANIPDRPDASGLLGGDENDWKPGTGLVDVPDAPGGAFPGGAGLGGMPMMPGMPGGGGMPQGGGSGIPERPDAAGLVGGDPSEWETPGDLGVDVPNAPGGAVAGGAGLGGMPAMPGMPRGMPQGGAGSGLPERPDAAGLVGGDPSEWETPGDLGVDVPNAPGGAVAGGAGLGGMPAMPGMPGGMPQGGAGSGLPERPDAAGLVGGDPSEWETPGDLGADVPNAPGGAVAGGAGLGGVPMMPGMPGGGGMPQGGGSGSGLPERPDAAGLVGGDPSEWETPGDGADVPDAPAGTVAGGAGLGGVPMLPGVPGGGGAPNGAGSGLPERPDAAGLVGGDPAEWTPGDMGAVPDAPAGAAPGGIGLDGGTFVPPIGPAQQPAANGGVPMTPGSPPGGGPQGKDAERPVAAGLVDGRPQEWIVADAAAEPGTPDGAAPGGAGLVSPVSPPVDPALGGHDGVNLPSAGSPFLVMPTVPEPEEREQAERPEAAELLVEEEQTWTGEPEAGQPEQPALPEDDRVPVLRADDGQGDRSAWDDPGQSWWLQGDGHEREENLSDA